ncbi:hypothetical protein TVAG_230910 [Trichomonas vaginalis G3]|uniref:Uncharacterized protein n=1 Tax=Trichomonas vaginalis (strain ATCC PRA-98 / G3) TaxID=412133 RepID=A2EE19_TRIV3|nr:hypothetical protein TVAGG3_0889890 [Trichomonas vaginalis G3]EAY09131.1 hypothetical protein TVAG_230910 [Trichomonas vaginalis G3]KAI5502637.1 hypothetical protein TVAGG3_0889890 [Trichomonas vaginalis G3]|eukprot:XP_001321354.1 hypothetical protein [Trichomonas vaginalis G3]
MATFNRPCHDIFIETGDQLRFIAAVPQSKLASEANITLDQEQDICAWLISPSGSAEYSVSTYYLAPDKSFAEIYPVNNISGFSMVLKYAGSALHESIVTGKSIMLYYHNELETYSDEYIKVQSKNIQHITNVSYSSLAFKRNNTIRYIVPSSMGTTNSVFDESNSMSKKKIVIMVSVLGSIAGVWVIIGVIYWITNKRRKQRMNESTANPVYPRYRADSVPQNHLEEIEFSTSTSTNPAPVPTAEPYAMESSDDQNNPYLDADL